jgi:hypothetical protein
VAGLSAILQASQLNDINKAQNENGEAEATTLPIIN